MLFDREQLRFWDNAKVAKAPGRKLRKIRLKVGHEVVTALCDGDRNLHREAHAVKERQRAQDACADSPRDEIVKDTTIARAGRERGVRIRSEQRYLHREVRGDLRPLNTNNALSVGRRLITLDPKVANLNELGGSKTRKGEE